MKRTGVTWLVLGLLAAPPLAPNALSFQSVTLREIDKAIDENARAGAYDSAWVAKQKARADSLVSDGADAEGYLAKLSEGLAKRVPAERLAPVMAAYADALRDARRLAADHRLAGKQTERAAAQLILAGASDGQVRELMRASRGREDAPRRFQSSAFGAIALKNGGSAWAEAAKFQATLAARKDLSVEEIEDVNTAVSAALADRLVAPKDLPDLAERELRTPDEARAFVGAVRGGEGREKRLHRDKKDAGDTADAVKAGRKESAEKLSGGGDGGGGGDDGDTKSRGKPRKPNQPGKNDK